MNSIALKIGAIVLFVSGIVAYVAFKNGYFHDEESETEMENARIKETVQELDSTEEIKVESEIAAKEKVLEETVRGPEGFPKETVKSTITDRERMSSSKSMQIVDFEDIRMFSSKSAPIFEPRELTPAIVQPKDTNKNMEPNANQSINKTPGKQQMGGSKSIRMFNANDMKLNAADTSDR